MCTLLLLTARAPILSLFSEMGHSNLNFYTPGGSGKVCHLDFYIALRCEYKDTRYSPERKEPFFLPLLSFTYLWYFYVPGTTNAAKVSCTNSKQFVPKMFFSVLKTELSTSSRKNAQVKVTSTVAPGTLSIIHGFHTRCVNAYSL